MKKIITLVVAVAISTAMFAQSVSVFHIGGNVSKFTGKNGYGDYTPGYQVGFSNDFGGRLSVEPGIFLIHKGTQRKLGDDRHVTSLNYLQIPVNMKFNLEIGKMRLIIGAGVYGSVGLWGNTKTNGKKTENIVFFDNKRVNRFKTLDFGGQVFAGVIVDRFGVSFGYQPGFTNIHENKDSRIYNNSIYLNLSFLLGDPAKRNAKK